MPADCRILYLNDFKKAFRKAARRAFSGDQRKSGQLGSGNCRALAEIDEINILQATYRAMRQAVGQLNPAPGVLLNERRYHTELPESLTQVPIIKGDAKSVSIAAASILAKVTRDHMMIEYGQDLSGIWIYPSQRIRDSRPY